MNARDKKAIEVTRKIKNDMRELINKYSTECSEIAVNSPDPHLPVIAACQMAFVEAATAYMILCGAKPEDALQGVINVTGIAMENWINAIIKGNNLKAETKVNKTIIVPDESSIN